MKRLKYKSLSAKQLLAAVFILFLFAGITLFLFTNKRDEKQYSRITSELFRNEMLASTLNMHYSLAYPENFGIIDYQVVLPCYTSDSQIHSQTATENLLSTLSKIDASKLSKTDAYSYKLLTRSLENSLALNSFEYYEEPLSPSSGMQSQLPILLAEYTFRRKQDVIDYLALLDQTDEYFSSLLVFEQEKAAAGLLMPASSLKKIIKQCDTIVTSKELDAGTHFLQSTFTERIQSLYTLGELTAEEVSLLTNENNRLLKNVLLPAYGTLADGLFLLQDESIPLQGLAGKPNGAEYYQYLLRSETGSYRDIDEIRTLLTETLEQEYNNIQALVSANPDILLYLQTNEYENFPLATADTILTDLQRRMAKDFPLLPSYDTQTPAITVKTVSPSLEKYCAPAFYLTAPLDDTDNNVIYINQKNSPSGLELYTTLAHEGYPGHLYQTVYNNRNCIHTDENIVRELLWYGGYLEGWALYVEFISFDYAAALMKEQGDEMTSVSIQIEKHNRSMQLCLYSLLDLMIHYDNASYSQVAKVLESIGITNTASVKAIYTYIAEEPCNYPKYYLGYLEILQLKKEAHKLWGDAYSDYLFHSFYLDCGPSDFTSLLERLASDTVRKN
uniref:DUF885 domain-containing protein n=1 Tax=Acetatifactor sp. TaxID=1872090 RepID=UPI0040579C0D